MLKIIMGSEYAEQYLKNKKFIEFPNSYFNELKESKWFANDFVQEIIRKIDKAYVETGFAVHSIEYDEGYSVNDLAGGSKFLILAHMLRDNVYLATMGDNCCDFLERIAMDYEKEGKDLIVVANYLHKFQFNYVNAIEYINWDTVCHSWNDIEYKIYNKWIEQEKMDYAESDEDEEDENDDSKFAIMDRIANRGIKGDC